MTSDRVFFDATVPAAAAAVFVRDRPDFLRWAEGRGRNLMLAGDEASGRALLRFVETTKAAGRAVLEDRERRKRGSRPPARSGSSEVAERGDEATSERFPPPGLTTRQVAEMLELTERQIRAMCNSAQLSATRVKGTWRVDEWSALAEADRRRQKGVLDE